MHEELIRIYLLELFYTVMCNSEENTESINITNQKNIVYRFEKLIEQNYTTEHYPKFYADKLAITANYLNFVCKNFSGKKAGEIIRDRVILEAKRLLVNSELSISQISFQLGFDDNSYFTKFFKTFSGSSPSEFRNTLNK
jgi:AraC-like DNA-binding protein